MTLYVKESGTPGAPSIIFLHGVGASGWMWKPQIATLADFHCITVDLPGHGKSNPIQWVSLRDTADQVAAVIEQYATNGRAHVVGLSLGGHIALELLEHHTDVLKRVVISGVTAEPMPNRFLLPLQLRLTTFGMKRRGLVERQAKAMHLSPDMQADFTENLLAMDMQAYRRIWEEVVDFRLSPRLRDVHTPTLITAGGNESKIIIQAVSALSLLMPNAQGRLAPGRGHGWNVEVPDLFSAMVRAWVTDTPLPSELQKIMLTS